MAVCSASASEPLDHRRHTRATMAELGGRKRQMQCSMTVNIGSDVMQRMPAIPIEQRDEEEGG